MVSARKRLIAACRSETDRNTPLLRRRLVSLAKKPSTALSQEADVGVKWNVQPGLPMKPGRAGTMTHDYKRHGTTRLFAALNILDGTVIGRNMQRHRHQEFIRFLNTIEAQVPKRKAIHAIVDNYATHKPVSYTHLTLPTKA